MLYGYDTSQDTTYIINPNHITFVEIEEGYGEEGNLKKVEVNMSVEDDAYYLIFDGQDAEDFLAAFNGWQRDNFTLNYGKRD